MEKNQKLYEKIEKNETLYEKIESKTYGLLGPISDLAIIVGAAGIIAGFMGGEKSISDMGYNTFAISGMLKTWGYISKKRPKPVFGLEGKIGE
jgi:hypothetical protein